MNGKQSASIASAVPGGRWSRLAKLGGMATGVVGGMLAESARQLAQGNRPRLGDMLMTPGNARRVVEQLAQLRGAAMKVGQLLSMDAGEFLPPELSEILARLRAEANPMPMSQLVGVLDANWGKGWDRHFQRFSFIPVAAASIGQVHLAQTREGRRLAIKVQYPGVRESIDSDVDNVATLLRISGLLPKTLNLAPLLREAKIQLHAEADYLAEGAWLCRYGSLLADSPAYVLPELYADLTTPQVLAMSCLGGVPVESLAAENLVPQTERDHVAGLLFALLFREIFDFRLIQTDPNFANFRYDRDTRQLILLDFGATRAYPAAIVDGYRRLMLGAIDSDRPAMSKASADIGFFQADIQDRHRRMVLDIVDCACEPLSHPGAYDFGQTTLAARLREAGMLLGREKDFGHTPPADAVFLHRKLGGLYLLAARLKARVNLRDLLQDQAMRPSRQAPGRLAAACE
ncbi:MAG: AarF/ABC1/UbiB kinase family protein [Sulfuritalea sp.]|nr:AarF/ABC1/UbiB kinase family protein [Sulfuritalea sp.]